MELNESDNETSPWSVFCFYFICQESTATQQAPISNTYTSSCHLVVQRFDAYKFSIFLAVRLVDGWSHPFSLFRADKVTYFQCSNPLHWNLCRVVLIKIAPFIASMAFTQTGDWTEQHQSEIAFDFWKRATLWLPSFGTQFKRYWIGRLDQTTITLSFSTVIAHFLYASFGSHPTDRWHGTFFFFSIFDLPRVRKSSSKFPAVAQRASVVDRRH